MINNKLFLSTTITSNLLGFVKYRESSDSFCDTDIERLIECICMKTLDNDFKPKDKYITDKKIYSKYAQFMVDVDSIRLDSKKQYNSINIDYELCHFICLYLLNNKIKSSFGDLFILICKKQFANNDELYYFLDVGSGSIPPYDFDTSSVERFKKRVLVAMDKCSSKYNTKIKITQQKREEKLRGNAL